MANKDNNDNNDKRQSGDAVAPAVLEKAKTKPKKPHLYKVILLNDDYTPMDFVVEILQIFFHKNLDEATQLMLKIHKEGSAVCGIYTYEIAETKVTQVMEYSKQNQHPLQCVMEKNS